MLGPIFNRELLTLPRRSRHYTLRAAYLGLLWVLAMTAWQSVVGWERTATLGDTARFGLLLFQLLTVVQLTLLLFFSALSAANTITLEKDRRTFILILLTDLRNYEIVLGKLLGSLLQIFLFLAATVPVLMLLLLLGGVSVGQVLQAVAVLAGTSVAAGSLGCLVALWREKTFQSLALTVLFLVLYICLIRGLVVLPGLLSWASGGEASLSEHTVQTWQQWLEPFLALQSVLEPPTAESVALPPAYGFALTMVALSVLLNLWSILRLRVWNPSGEPIIQRENVEEEPVTEEEKEKERARAHAAPGRIRPVWPNPILWREIATRGYGRRPLLVKFAYLLVLALICFYALTPVVSGRAPEWAAAWGLVPVCVLSLLLVAAQSVTAITSERDTGALDLLLVTDLTPREFIFGKLGGICYNTKEFLLPPLILAIFYGVNGYLASPPELGRNMESLFCVLVGTVVLLAFTLVLGIHVALRTETSRQAVLHALGTVFFLSVGTLVCIYLILINGRFEYQWLSFIFFLAAAVGGLWWVLNGDRPSPALTLAAWVCPFAVLYSVMNVMIGRPGTHESSDPFLPFLVTAGAFGFALAAMLVPLLSEFDVAFGRTSAGGD
jgi:ABC-type transport system involved in multi-copper enzyme maturation permease subunit